MPTNETLYKQIQQKMATTEVSKKLKSWLAQADATRKFIKENKINFHEWKPLKFYVTLGKANVFSLRYKGQEVALLACFPKKAIVKFGDTLIERNERYFNYSPLHQEFEWQKSEGTNFRHHFAKNDFFVHSPEHCIESGLIAGLISSRKPPKSTLRKRTAVTFEGFPLQFPVAFSASEGEIGTSSGHIDILGRKQGGVLSIWELKSPNVYKGAAWQAYIYALQIHSIINDPNIGKEWLKLFEIRRGSKAIKIEVLVGVSEKYKEQVKKEIYALKEEMKVDGIEALFSWNIASYGADHDAHKITIQQIS